MIYNVTHIQKRISFSPKKKREKKEKKFFLHNEARVWKLLGVRISSLRPRDTHTHSHTRTKKKGKCNAVKWPMWKSHKISYNLALGERYTALLSRAMLNVLCDHCTFARLNTTPLVLRKSRNCYRPPLPRAFPVYWALFVAFLSVHIYIYFSITKFSCFNLFYLPSFISKYFIFVLRTFYLSLISFLRNI